MTDNVEANKFGTFGGVFTPCVLTILGVIMFLRFGQIVGNSGLWAALVIVLASNVITLLTALSLSAIATNTRVKGGGAYYLISRSLGIIDSIWAILNKPLKVASKPSASSIRTATAPRCSPSSSRS